jgi:hypothetical protein
MSSIHWEGYVCALAGVITLVLVCWRSFGPGRTSAALAVAGHD